ncbi:MAG: hypothetical protein HY962_13925 [Ignavibacteriae bacterium]|nr:hypothetical protein [Ignavibacteriota bacterium]
MAHRHIAMISGIALLMLLVQAPAPAQRGKFGNAPQAKSVRLGSNVGFTLLGDDLTKSSDNYRVGVMGTLDFLYLFHPQFGAGLFAGLGTMSSSFGGQTASTFYGWYGTQFEGRFIWSRGAIVPFVFLRLGGLTHKPQFVTNGNTVEGETETIFTYGGGVGMEILMYRGRKPLYLRLTYGSNLTSSDELDNIVSGDQRDGFSYLTVGVSYYFGRR